MAAWLRGPHTYRGALLSWSRGSPDRPPPPDTLAAGSRQAAGLAPSSVAPGGCDFAASPPLWAGSWVLPLQYPGIQAKQTAYERRGRGYGRGPHSLGDPPGLELRRGRRLRTLPLLPEPPPGTAPTPIEAPATKPGKRLKLILVPEAARVTHRVRGLQALDERRALRLISRAASFVTSR
ncbi:hypothetical protein CapIbe_006005 [Capra ibex]